MQRWWKLKRSRSKDFGRPEVERLTTQVSYVTAGFAGLIFVLNMINTLFFLPVPVLVGLANPSVWLLALFALFFSLSRFLPQLLMRSIQPTLFILLSGPMVLPSTFTFFGLWFFVLGNVLLYKYGLMEQLRTLKLLAVLGYFLPFFISGVLNTDGQAGSVIRLANYFIFLIASLGYLYVIFEIQILSLVNTNKQKDEELAEKDAEIARLVPLSVLGERVAHVAHSFKNNLSLLSTAQFHLENGGDPAKAAQKLKDFSRSMDERIDNILMVSRAGADQAPEVFDAARLLAGLNQVYLTEPAFLQRAKIELSADEATPVYAVRWDFLLLAENILTNALEALTAKGGYGTIRVTLKDRLLTLANDGGAMATCHDCRNDCLSCSKYGKPGRTTKAKGSGHGLAQVFSVCRKHGWTLRIRTHEEWTLFEIGLTKAEPAQPRV